MKRYIVSITTLAWFACHALPLSAAERIAPILNSAPTLDGKIDTEEWADALPLGELVGTDGNLPKYKTQAWLGIHDSVFYLAIRCEEPTPGRMRTKTIRDERDGDVYADDSVDFFIDVGRTGKSFYHLTVNSEGTLYDAEVIGDRRSAEMWDSDAVVRAHVGASSWAVEMALPMQSLGHQFVAGEVFAINVARTRRAETPRQISSLAKGRYSEPANFIPLLVKGRIASENLSLVSTQRGPFYQKAVGKLSGKWEFDIENKGTGAVTLEARFGKETAESRRETIKPGHHTLSFPISPEDVEAMNRCTLVLEGSEIYHSEYSVRSGDMPGPVQKTKAPLFEELIEDRPDGLSRAGALIWGSAVTQVDEMSRLALRTGTEYSMDAVFQELKKDYAIRPIKTQGWGLPSRVGYSKKYKVPVVVELDNRPAFRKGVPKWTRSGREMPWAPDPRSIKAELDDTRKAIAISRENPGLVWGVMAGDEAFGHMDKILRLMLDRKGEYPALAQTEQEIRTNYGFGKFGLPESSADTNPYRWIATQRWLNDQMLANARQVRALLREEAPGLKYISWVNHSGHFPLNISRWGEVFDIITGQLPAGTGGPDRHRWGFITKLLSDLSGSAEVWPCAHVEHYRHNHTPEETEELISQVLRNGGTGLYLWPPDIKQNRIGSQGFRVDPIGAPERWNAVRAINHRLARHPFKVRQPVPDTAIYYSNTSYQGQPDFHKSGEVEWIYTILGPRLQSALKFIDDLLCGEEPEKLLSYKVIHIPYAPITDDRELEGLESYVRQGGTLIVSDPMAFRNRSDGSQRQAGALLPPLESTRPATSGEITVQNGESPLQLPALGSGYSFAHNDDLPLATYADGGRAMVERTVGKGRVIFFGFNPLTTRVIKDHHWINWFGILQRTAGASAANTVWRFRLPKGAPYEAPPRPPGVCLTGNYFEWSMSTPVPMKNSSVGGSYRLGNAPDGSSEPTGTAIPFGVGRLTNRLSATAGPNDAPPSNLALTWKNSDSIEIVYHFEKPVTVKQLRLFFSGTLPDGTCEISSDGKTWNAVAEWKGRAAWDGLLIEEKQAVAKQTVELPSKRASYVRLLLSPTPGAPGFTLAETDIWGEE
ncbi:MAG TPA: hypothetical protein VNQ90_19055 [Chthoniobacteraceae bacterium]|nr:hypothetical protein [Chthoniobacteraceae bacterium]